MSLLELRGVDVAYGDLPALRGVSLTIDEGEILSVVGANGAGKTTMLRTISGLLRPRAGEILLDGARIDRLPSHAVVERGVVQVPEGRKIFPSLTVRENLELGAYSRRGPPAPRARAWSASSRCSRILAERAAPGRRHHVGRPAADARHRPGADGPPAPPHAGRAVARAGAHGSCRRSSAPWRRSTARGPR